MQLKELLNNSFKKENFLNYLDENLNIDRFEKPIITPIKNEQIEFYTKIASKELSDKNMIDVFIFQTHKENIEQVRVGFNDFIASLVPRKYNFDGALVAIYHPKSDVWRLSFVHVEFTDDNKIELKTSPQRYTFELGKEIPHLTALEQLSDIKSTISMAELREIFSVEKVSNKFFKEYKELYYELVSLDEVTQEIKDTQNQKLFAKKLLGRIVFLYFLQKKGWLGSKEEWGDGNPKFMKEIFDNYKGNDFYAEILNPIFFEALNFKRESDYFKLLDCKIPFLNGGLFTPLDFELNSNNKPLAMLKNKVFEKIFQMFNSYNFTIIEDTPHDSEVAIDPEMLGRVFEDLLEDRKDKGAFYTPREIVHYMAKKSIESYLQTEVQEYKYDFSVGEFLKKVSLSDEQILEYHQRHPIKFVTIPNYFKKFLSYENLVIDFWIVAKLKGFRLDAKGQRKKTDRGHPTVTKTIWKKILEHDYEIIDINFGSNKEIKLSKTYHYPTITKYIKIDDKYFTLAFLPNIWGDLELTTIFPMRERAIRSKLKKFDKSLNELNEKSFAFNSEVFSKIKELREDCRSLHPEPLQNEAELPRQAVVQKGLSTFQNSFNVDSITDESLTEFLKDKDYYNITINQLLSNSTIPQNKLKDIMNSRLKDIKTLDPAIGSGAFPMGVLHELLETRVKLGDKTPSSKMKREIIENNIYGIDIDESAVEIAKLRFWISIVVDEKVPKPLPNLFYKIMVGNSLLDTANGFDLLQARTKGSKVELDRLKALQDLDKLFAEYYNLHDKSKKDGLRHNIDIQFKVLFDKGLKEYSKHTKLIGATKKEEDEAKTANLIVDILKDMYDNHYSNKIFLYKLYFKEVMDKGGFDLVIGNPPYLRVQGIDKDSSQQYKKVFNSATGSYDLYVLFVEKGLELLSKNGILNYIIPHKWINASFGKGLREITKSKVSSFISFGAYQVFNASTYTSLVWWQKNKKNKHLNYVELDKNLDTNKELENYLFNLKDNDFTKIKDSDLTSANWTFTDKKTYEVLEKLKEQPKRLSDIFEYIQVGTQVMGDDIYHIKGIFKNDKFIGYSKRLDKEIVLEKEIIKPLLVGDDVKRYSTLKNQYYMIYPHFLENKKTKPYEEIEFKKKFPLTYEYLLNFKDELIKKKIKYNTNIKYWYSLHRARDISLFEQEKILTAETSLGCNMTIDFSKYYTNTQNYSFVKNREVHESYKFYLSILNSKLLWFFIKNTGSVLSNGYFRFKTNYLNPFPIPKIENIEDTKPFEILVDKIIKLKEQNKDTKKLEDEIDSMVYKLYGLSDEEVLIVEGSV